MTQRVIALGFDPGLATTGYGVVRRSSTGWEAVAGGTIETPPAIARATRLQKIYEEACALIQAYHPDGVAIEEVYMAKNTRTAMLTAETRGVLLLAAADVPIYCYTPLQVKKQITSYGRANKKQVQLMVKRLLHLAEVPQPDDMADGLAIALCCLIELSGVQPEKHAYL